MSTVPRHTDPDATAGRLRAELDFLSELCVMVSSDTPLEAMLDWIVEKTTAMLGADEGSIKLLRDDTPAEAPPETLIRTLKPGIESGSWPMAISAAVMGYLVVHGGVLASPDIREDEDFPGLRKIETRIRGVVAVPLRVGQRITGMLAVTTLAPGREWTQTDIQLMEIVASHSAGVIENARLRVSEREREALAREKQKHDRDLILARDIQMGLVPDRPLALGPWEVHGRVVPTHRVGGDGFDYFALGPSTLGLALADVSGKGVPASLLMMNVHASIRAFCDGRHAVAEAVGLVNQSIARMGSAGKFVTLFYGELDAANGTLRYTNAGHNYPFLLRRNGSVEYLDRGGLILGIFADTRYQQGETSFGEGDRLLVYSDGLPDTENADGEPYGDERLIALWTACARHPPAEAVERLFAGLGAYRGPAPQVDDMTAVVVGPRGPA